jgi:hypothetical protein
MCSRVRFRRPLAVTGWGIACGGRRRMSNDRRRTRTTPLGWWHRRAGPVRGDGGPFTAWATVFERTADRIRARFEPRFPHVHPHRLRHCFSMQTLEYLVTGFYRQAAKLVRDTDADAALIFYLTKADPLLVLRDLLGHSTVLTTEHRNRFQHHRPGRLRTRRTGKDHEMTTKTTRPAKTCAGKPSAAEAASRYHQLRSHLAALKLHAAAEALPTVLDEAAAQQLSLTTELERLLAIEVEDTDARRLASRLRFACLPTPATLDNFDVDAASGIDRAMINELGTCRYLESATNVLLIGTGKTHLAVGLARAAAHAGYRTYFTTAADLAARCHRAAIEGRWATTMRFYAGPALLVLDLSRPRDYAESATP